jgi:beta-glucosidase
VEITNTGSIAGKEVAQLYLSFPSNTNSPKNQLRGFDKVFVSPGAKETAKFSLTSRDLSYWDGEWKLIRGSVGLLVGASSRDIRLTSNLVI